MRDSFEVESVRRHLLFILTGDVAHRLQALRVRWDPVMARRIPPHVSLVYPEEADDEALLLRRAASVAEKAAPFDIFFGLTIGDEPAVVLSHLLPRRTSDAQRDLFDGRLT